MLVDGENLVLRYEAMLESGRMPAVSGGDTVHDPGRLLWRSALPQRHDHEIIRVSYFTIVVGNDEAVAELEDRISSVKYYFSPHPGTTRSGYLCPRVFKKPKGGSKNKSVDINITIDALRHAFSRSVDRIVLLSGDGDFVPLIQEVMRQGVQVIAGAFSDGASPDLRRVADDFLDLDREFFVPLP